MGYTARISRGRTEADAEALVFVLVADGKQFGIRGKVPPHAGRAGKFLRRLFSDKFKTVNLHVCS